MVSSSPRVLPSSTWLKLLHHYNQVQGEKGGGRQWFPFFKIKKIFFFFLAALGLHCCARAFSSCGEWGLLFGVVRGLLLAVASLVAEPGMQAQ